MTLRYFVLTARPTQHPVRRSVSSALLSDPAMASPVLGSSLSPNLFDTYAHGLNQGHTVGENHDGHDRPKYEGSTSPPTATNGDPFVSRHALDAAIAESPVEERQAALEDAKDGDVVRRASVHRPSPLSGVSATRNRSTSGAHTSGSSSEPPQQATKAKKEKGGLMRKLSGLNFLHHERAHGDPSQSATKSNRNTSGPVPAVASSPTRDRTSRLHPDPPSNESRPKFTFGDSASASPAGSNLPSRTPSLDNMSIANARRTSSIDTRAQSRTPSADSSKVSPAKDPGDFVPRAPQRANSTFNFFRKNTAKDTQVFSPPPRAASFTHGATGPVAIPGTHHAAESTPMGSLSRTLSKASLVGGMGWGSITEKLPTFESLYTWKDANEKKIKLDLNNKSGQIGEGAGGVIRTARLKDRCHPAYHPHSRGGDLGLFAVKTFRKQSDRESEGWYCQKLVREFRIHCALAHDNIVKLADICVEQKKFGEPQFVAVLDFCVGGDLFDLHYHQWNSIDQGVMSKVERNCVFKQLMFAVNYMHDLGIAHRDIKLENMLINGHGQMKLADFGTSVFTTGPDAEECRGFVGTDHSVPPEAYLSSMSKSQPKPVYDGLKADIWACAVTWHILTWSNDEPMAALRAYPFGPEGADPDNKTWQKYMNSIKRYEPNKFIPGWDYYMERKIEKNGTPPMTPSVDRKDSMAMSATSGQSGVSELDMMFDISDPSPAAPTDDLRDPLRRCRPFANGFPGSGFTAAKGMLDPDPALRWSARQVLDDPFFALIECCQTDSNPHGYDASKERARKGLKKVHNHIRSSARKLMEVSKVEQQRNQELVDSKRLEK